MIKKKTVFVIGAGASQPFQFPTGRALIQRISQRLDIEPEDWESFTFKRGDREIFMALAKKAEAEGRANWTMFQQMLFDLRRMSESLKQVQSIDAFLDYHKDNAFMVLAGKLGIVRALLDSERDSGLVISPWDQRMNWDVAGATWYFDFWQALASGASKENISRIYENCTFVLFNYDRCFESMLFDGLRNHFHISDAEAGKIARSAKIFHPYGVLGPLGWQCEGSQQPVPFGDKFVGEALLPLASQIRTFSEQMSDTDELSQLRSRVADADRIVFLGFGFHTPNMDILTPLRGEREKYLSSWGTAFGLSDRDREHFEVEIMGRMQGPKGSQATLIDQDCSGFFRQYGLELAR